MKPATVNGKKVFFNVILNEGDPFILISDQEWASEGINKIYFQTKLLYEKTLKL